MRFDNEVTLRVNSESIINWIFQQAVDSIERVVSAIVFEEHFSTVLMFFSMIYFRTKWVLNKIFLDYKNRLFEFNIHSRSSIIVVSKELPILTSLSLEGLKILPICIIVSALQENRTIWKSCVEVYIKISLIEKIKRNWKVLSKHCGSVYEYLSWDL